MLIWITFKFTGAIWLYALFYVFLVSAGIVLVVVEEDPKEGIACFIVMGIVTVLYMVSQMYFLYFYRRRVIFHIIYHFYLSKYNLLVRKRSNE